MGTALTQAHLWRKSPPPGGVYAAKSINFQRLFFFCFFFVEHSMQSSKKASTGIVCLMSLYAALLSIPSLPPLLLCSVAVLPFSPRLAFSLFSFIPITGGFSFVSRKLVIKRQLLIRPERLSKRYTVLKWEKRGVGEWRIENREVGQRTKGRWGETTRRASVPRVTHLVSRLIIHSFGVFYRELPNPKKSKHRTCESKGGLINNTKNK